MSERSDEIPVRDGSFKPFSFARAIPAGTGEKAPQVDNPRRNILAVFCCVATGKRAKCFICCSDATFQACFVASLQQHKAKADETLTVANELDNDLAV